MTDFLLSIESLSAPSVFSAVAGASTDTILVVDPVSYKIKYINRVQPGFTFDQVIGAEVFSFVWPQYHETYRQKLEIIREKGGKELIQLEGESGDGKAWYNSYLLRLSEEQGNKSDILILAENITDTKVRIIQSIENESRLKAIINNTVDMICSLDLNYCLMEFNSTLAQTVKAGFNVDLKPGMELLPYIDPKKHEHLRSIYKRVENGETCNDIESFTTQNNDLIYFESSYNPIHDVNQKVIGISIFSKNITERVKNENQLRGALKEKGVLLSEVHHRIKNNLAVISSMLQLQELNLNNPEARLALSESRKRIQSTALVHELLYKRETFASIGLREYIQELFMNLRTTTQAELLLEGSDVALELATAMPLAMMLNEIMMNTFKHSQLGQGCGKINVSIKKENGSLVIVYKDPCGNIPDHVNFQSATSTGMTLIKTFAEQLDATIEMISRSPIAYKISIPAHE